MTTKPEFRIMVHGFYVANVRVQKAPDGGYDVAVRVDIAIPNEDESLQDVDLGWFVLGEADLVEYRDETAWALLSMEMKQTSVDKGWNTCTPHELIGILWTAGILT